MAKITAEQFCMWLQGFMEIQNPDSLDCTQTQIIKDHLIEVFDKVTPDRRKESLLSELPEGFEKLEIKPESFKKKSSPGFMRPGHSSRLLC
jgi:hypothetical protein